MEHRASQNSTNVRLVVLRSGLAALAAVSPGLAARAGERLFLSPPRHPAPATAPQIVSVFGGRASERRGHLVTSERELPNEPVPRERARTGEEDSHGWSPPLAK